MIKYEVGEQFPSKNPLSGEDITIADFTSGFVDIKCFMTNPTDAEIKAWCTGRMTYCLYTNRAVPFIVIDLPGFNLDVNINILKIKTEEQRTEWLNEEGNLITFFLVDAQTNVLVGMRAVSVHKELANKLKDTLEKQCEEYNTAEEVDLMIAKILHTVSTIHMLAISKLYRS